MRRFGAAEFEIIAHANPRAGCARSERESKTEAGIEADVTSESRSAWLEKGGAHVQTDGINKEIKEGPT